MIRRGTMLSRVLALLVMLGPPLGAIILFGAWASERWVDGGQAIAAADQRRHVAEARTTQARLFEPLGAAWSEYAATEFSGLVREESADAAAAAISTRLAAMFAAANGTLDVVERLADGPPARPGMQTLLIEVRGDAPEAQTPGLLAALEADPPFLFVEYLDVKRGAARGRLDLRLRLAAYRFEEAAP